MKMINQNWIPPLIRDQLKSIKKLVMSKDLKLESRIISPLKILYFMMNGDLVVKFLYPNYY